VPAVKNEVPEIAGEVLLIHTKCESASLQMIANRDERSLESLLTLGIEDDTHTNKEGNAPMGPQTRELLKRSANTRACMPALSATSG
jgi:hypothetical protein